MSYSDWQVEEFKRQLAELVKNGREAGMDSRNIAGALLDAADDMARQCGYPQGRWKPAFGLGCPADSIDERFTS
jgi:hypothetical protein